MPCTSGGRLSGILTETDLLQLLVHGRSRETKVAEIMVRNVSTVTAHESAATLPSIFERGEVAIVVDQDKSVQSILTKMGLIDYLSTRARLAAAR
jgi:predicted transcriptional regulator